MGVLSSFFTPATVERAFAPLMADFHYEVEEARRKGKTWRVRALYVTYSAALLIAAVRSKIAELSHAARSKAKR
jgi:hypothetical protein